MKKVPLNSSPDLSMVEITKLLFNNEFMSDVRFKVGGRVIYAHSWEVMKRSVVFRQRLRNSMGRNNLITIDDVTYEVFYQFIRFIYSDDCSIEEHLICDMLKLAVRYKIVKLEAKVLNMVKNTTTELNLFEFGILNQYDLCTYFALHKVLGFMTEEDTKTKTFLNIHSKALEEILKSDIALRHMTEVDLFKGLVRWMNKSCEQNQIPLTKRRSHFDTLIRLIRFPTMSPDEFHLCVRNHPGLFTNDDIGTIVRQKKLDVNYFWNIKPRLEYQYHSREQKYTYNSKWVTEFTVSDKLILHGIRHGIPWHIINNYETRITSYNRSSTISDGLNFWFNCSELVYDKICFGDSIILAPNFVYTIEIIFLPSFREEDDKTKFSICCRKPNIDAVVTGPADKVTFTETSDNLFEINFKSISVIDLIFNDI